MSAMATPELVQVAQADHRNRSERHARDCVYLAVVTSEEVASELIDKAIELRSAVRTER